MGMAAVFAEMLQIPKPDPNERRTDVAQETGGAYRSGSENWGQHGQGNNSDNDGRRSSRENCRQNRTMPDWRSGHFDD